MISLRLSARLDLSRWCDTFNFLSYFLWKEIVEVSFVRLFVKMRHLRRIELRIEDYFLRIFVRSYFDFEDRLISFALVIFKFSFIFSSVIKEDIMICFFLLPLFYCTMGFGSKSMAINIV